MEAVLSPISPQPDLLVNLAAATGLSIVCLPELLPRQYRLTWVAGPSGAGKTVHALDAALNGVRAGHHVVVFGVGHPIRTFARLTGGSLSRLLPDGSFAHQLIATRPVEVFDMGSCAYVAGTCTAPSSPVQLVRAADRQSMLLVDDFERTARLLPDLPRFLARSLEAGASAMVTARARIGDDAMRALRHLLGPLQVPITSVALTREL
jgi:hypothetical protein